MFKAKYFCDGCSLRSGVVAVVVMFLSIFCMQFGKVTANDGNFVVSIDAGFTCIDGTVIRARQRCDAKMDCRQWEDEFDCPNNVIIQSYFWIDQYYSYDFNDHSSALYKEFEHNITSSLKDYITTYYETGIHTKKMSIRLVAVTSSKSINVSSAVVDFELFFDVKKFTEVKREFSMYRFAAIWSNLHSGKRFGSLQAASVPRTYFEPDDIAQCSSTTEIPCMDSRICFPSSGRCDKVITCPKEDWDEFDCPPLDRCPGQSPNDKYSCPNSGGIMICNSRKCDGRKDCPGGEDEPPSCKDKPIRNP
ncbi:uncharacterized protein LOC135847814 isoform X2 [Planococcus citri]|uniref:uncharacterized protein LOC135847814 isoform X2 n=1 Tax=Planococcus citri TaxID=170843 RepID=UPI0031F9E60C